MKKTSINKVLRKAGKLLAAWAILLSPVPIFSQGGPPVMPTPCGVNNISFTQQTGFGNNNRMLIGGYGQNDGTICWNCYSDSSFYGRHRAFNLTSGPINAGAPVPSWSSRIFQDIPRGVLRIQSGFSQCMVYLNARKRKRCR
jgi:hypothetical protein